MYEAMLQSGNGRWRVGERVDVYRATGGRAVLYARSDEADDAPAATARDTRDYDTSHYARLLHGTFASRLIRAFSAEDFARVFADPGQPSLFEGDLSSVSAILTTLYTRAPAPET